MKRYASYSAEDFAEILVIFSPELIEGEEDIQRSADWLRRDRIYSPFKEALRAFLLDDSMTLGKKTSDHFLEDFPSGQAWDYWKWIWETFAPEDPWPLEGQERPDDERTYEFKR